MHMRTVHLAVLAHERADAERFDLFDLESGNLITWFDSREDLLAELPEILRSDAKRSEHLLVVAVDETGQRLASSPATELLGMS
jgi:hypothetical protein